MLGSTEKRLVVIFFAVTTIILGVISAVSLFKERHEAQLQAQEANQDVAILGLRLLSNQLDELGISVRDYAKWDATYDFVSSRNQDFVDENFSIRAIEEQHLTAVALLNGKNEVILRNGKITGYETIPLESHLQQVNIELDDVLFKGVLFHNENTYLFASSPIQNTLGTSSPNGRLIFFKHVSKRVETNISELIGHKVSALSISDKTQFFVFSAKDLWEIDTITQTTSDSVIKGEYQIGQKGHPRLPIIISASTANHKQGWKHLAIHLMPSVAALFIMPVLMILLLRRYITSPIQELIRWLNQVDGSQLAEELKPFKHAGNGEVGELSEKFSSIYNNLYQQHQFSQLLLYSISDVIFTVDHQGNIDYCNPAATEWLNIGATQLYGQSFEFLIANMSEDTPSPANWLYRAIHNASEYSGISKIRKFGEMTGWEWMEVQVSPMIKADDEPAGALIVLRSKPDYAQ
ncbi:CHASE4 domain-containing protein [Vibrio sp. TBV020]|uniref:CHASE4 domain-containing protein n=1 Tax=Vibrio sp. TBV020 TaxID=3137398 RepID=UPI0038CD397B